MHAHNTYRDYQATLNDPRWKYKRQHIIQRDQGKCRNCGSTEKLHVHHRQYHFLRVFQRFKNPWEYEDRLLITLCHTCHDTGHSAYTIPIQYL